MEPKKDLTTQTVIIEGGKTTKTSQGPKHDLLWTVRWKSAEVDLLKKRTDTSGVLNIVDGTIYQGGKDAATYTATRAFAEGKANVLHIEGDVHVRSISQNATLSCDTMIFFPDRDLIEARGHVKVSRADGVLEGFDEMLASTDLKTVGTRDLFRKP